MIIRSLVFYIKFELDIIPDIKNVKKLIWKSTKERRRINFGYSHGPIDFIRWKKNHSSVGFSEELQKKDELWRKTLVFVGGPYGFSDTVYSKHKEDFTFADDFSHQMVCLFYWAVVSRLYYFEERALSSPVKEVTSEQF
jgi:23S rRNA (pseudouridine1915-N3)-methyltransferase